MIKITWVSTTLVPIIPFGVTLIFINLVLVILTLRFYDTSNCITKNFGTSQFVTTNFGVSYFGTKLLLPFEVVILGMIVINYYSTN